MLQAISAISFPLGPADASEWSADLSFEHGFATLLWTQMYTSIERYIPLLTAESALA